MRMVVPLIEGSLINLPLDMMNLKKKQGEMQMDAQLRGKEET